VNSHTLILGIGNTLLSDEGIGVHVVRYLQTQHPTLPQVRYLDGGTLSFSLAADIEAATQLIVIDAAQWHSPPGTVRQLFNADMDAFLQRPSLSVHEVSLLDLLDISRLTGHCPAQRALIGIQPAKLDWGTQPSPAVAQVIPTAAMMALDLSKTWQTQVQGVL